MDDLYKGFQVSHILPHPRARSFSVAFLLENFAPTVSNIDRACFLPRNVGTGNWAFVFLELPWNVMVVQLGGWLEREKKTTIPRLPPNQVQEVTLGAANQLYS